MISERLPNVAPHAVKRWPLVYVGVLFCTLAAILTFQISHNGVYHDGRCGAQQWRHNYLWLDFSERDYDEFGIEETWRSAHRQPCHHLWLPGVLELDGGKYFPRLQWKAAVGIHVADLVDLIRSASDAELRHKDALGRTVLHWLVVHPDVEHRQQAIDLAVARGLGMDEKDAGGLSPRDWAAGGQ
jgi:hypothetical protein